MTLFESPLMPVLSGVLFVMGWVCILTQRNALKQVIGLKILLQGVTLMMILIGRAQDNLFLAQVLVISALVVEAVIISSALAMIVSVFRQVPDGDIDQLQELKG